MSSNKGHSHHQNGGFNTFGLSGLDLFQGLPGLNSFWVPPYAVQYAIPTNGSTQTVLYAPDGGSASHAGGGGGGGTSGGGGGSTTTSSGLVINISWDSSVVNAPSAFTTAVQAAAKYLESQFTDKVTVNLSIGWGEVNGTSLGSSTLGATESYLNSVSYSTLRSALSADATTTADKSAVASLPSSAPVSGTFWTTTAQSKALGLTSATSTSTDAYIGFSSTLPFTYSDTNGVAAGTYDFNGVALHEMTEAMGRIMLTGGTVGTTSSSYTLMDLFHYSSAGVRDFSASTAGYFSADGGNTNLGTLNTTSGGDSGDLASSMGYNSFDAFSNSGVVNPVTTNDLTMVDVLGWNPVLPSSPTGVALAPVTAGLAAAQGSSGLTANAALATVTQVGGSSSDTYTYTLGGAGAGSFALTTANNVATLAAGSSGVAGAANGTLYALTVTATDTTSGLSSPASALDVIVGSGGNDTVSVATLSAAIGTATPTLIYGLGGSDTLNGSGMTGHLWFASGVGADIMTGGGTGNTYMYSATADSTGSAMDLISNFASSHDVIDLTGLGSTLKYAGKIKGSSLGAGSIGWQASGGNTFVYVNTSGGSESLSSTNMKIELAGSVSLTSGNFLHH